MHVGANFTVRTHPVLRRVLAVLLLIVVRVVNLLGEVVGKFTLLVLALFDVGAHRLVVGVEAEGAAPVVGVVAEAAVLRLATSRAVALFELVEHKRQKQRVLG